MQYIAAVFLWTGLATLTGAAHQDLCSDLPPSCVPGEWPLCESDGIGHVWKCVNVAGNPSLRAGNSDKPAASGPALHDHGASSVYGVDPSGVVHSARFAGFALHGYGARGSAPVVEYGPSSSGFGGAPAGYRAQQSSFPMSNSAFVGSPSAGIAAIGSGFGGATATHEASNSGLSGSDVAGYASSSKFGSAPAALPLNSREGFGAPSSGYGGSPVAFGSYASSLNGQAAARNAVQAPGLPSSSLHNEFGGNYAGKEASMATGSSGQQAAAARNNAQQMLASAVLVPNPSGGSGTGSYGYGTYASSAGNPSQGAFPSAPAHGPNASNGYGQGVEASSPYGQGAAASIIYGRGPSGSSPYGQGPAASSPYGYPSSGYALPQQSVYSSGRGFGQFASDPASVSAGFEPLPVPSAGDGLKRIFKPFWPQTAPASSSARVSAPAKAASSGIEPPGKSPSAGFPGKPGAKRGKADSKIPLPSSSRFSSPISTSETNRTASAPLSGWNPLNNKKPWNVGNAKSQRSSSFRKKTKKNSNKYN